MTAAPGKSCGSCTMCCSALEIAHFNKPAGPLCLNCRIGGGCASTLSGRRFVATSSANGLPVATCRGNCVRTWSGQSSWRTPIATNIAPFARRKADGLASSDGVRPSGRDGQVRPDRRRQGGDDVMADLRLGRMGTDGLIGRPFIGQNAHRKGAGATVGPFLTSWQAPGSAIRDPMLLSAARAGPAAAAEGRGAGGATRGEQEFRRT